MKNHFIKHMHLFFIMLSSSLTAIIRTIKSLRASTDKTEREKSRERRTGMDRNEFVLAVMASCPDATYNPVQVQKLFFLIDKKIPKLVGGPHFKFAPYHYGPFDCTVYSALEVLSTDGSIAIEGAGGSRTYTTTKRGQKKGEDLIDKLPDKAREYIKKLSEFVRSLSFNELVSAIYQAYPDMRANSVFRD